jgi:hypothetical protein
MVRSPRFPIGVQISVRGGFSFPCSDFNPSAFNLQPSAFSAYHPSATLLTSFSAMR